MKIYLDNCCYNRLFDDRSNIKNYLEREAVLIVMQKAFDKELNVVGSEVLEIEISNIKAFDSLHLASAENGADVLLTTDSKFLKGSQGVKTKIGVKNPVQFVMEVFNYDKPDNEDNEK